MVDIFDDKCDLVGVAKSNSIQGEGWYPNWVALGQERQAHTQLLGRGNAIVDKVRREERAYSWW